MTDGDQHERVIRILLLEDDENDAHFVRKGLAEADIQSDLTHVETVQEAVEVLTSGPVDVVLSDLALPDSRGLETVSKLSQASPDTPIVVLTGYLDEDTAVDAVRHGAQEYLVKDHISGPAMVRAIHTALQRNRTNSEARAERERLRLERELQWLKQMSSRKTDITSGLYASGPMSQVLPGTFDDLVQQYETIMDKALEERVLDVDHRISDKIDAIAQELGYLNAGPRDVAELHATALKRKCGRAQGQKAKAFLAEGHMLVLELMGKLASFYRSYAMGASHRPPYRSEEDTSR